MGPYSAMLLTAKSSNGLGVVRGCPHPFPIRRSGLRGRELLRHPGLRYSSLKCSKTGGGASIHRGALLGVDEVHVFG